MYCTFGIFLYYINIYIRKYILENYVTYNHSTGKVEMNDNQSVKNDAFLVLSKSLIHLQSPRAINCSFDVQTKNFNIWSVKTNCDWVKIPNNLGRGSGTAWLEVGNNDTGNRRVATISVTIKDKKKTLYIVQEAEYMYYYNGVQVNGDQQYIDVELPLIDVKKRKMLLNISVTNSTNAYGISTIGDFKIGIANGKVMFNGGETDFYGGALKVEIDKYGIIVNDVPCSGEIALDGVLTLRLSANIVFRSLECYTEMNNEYILTNDFRITSIDDDLVLNDLMGKTKTVVCKKNKATNIEIPDLFTVDTFELRLLNFPEATSIVETVMSDTDNWSVEGVFLNDVEWFSVEKVDEMTIRIKTTENKGETRKGVFRVTDWEQTKEYEFVQAGKEEYEQQFAVELLNIKPIETGLALDPQTDNVLVEYSKIGEDDFYIFNSRCYSYTTALNGYGFVAYYTTNDRIGNDQQHPALTILENGGHLLLKRFKVFRKSTIIYDLVPVKYENEYCLLERCSGNYIHDKGIYPYYPKFKQEEIPELIETVPEITYTELSKALTTPIQVAFDAI